MRIHDKSGKALICAYWDNVRYGNVSEREISFAVKLAAMALKYPEGGSQLKGQIPTL